MERYSKQREVILNSLKKRCDHPTAEMLYQDLKDEMPSVGIATIYRNLAKLSDEGKILKLTCQNGKCRYDGNLEEHIHFECETCHKIYDIFLEDKSNFRKEIIKIVNTIEAEINQYEFIIRGYCKNCKKKKEEMK